MKTELIVNEPKELEKQSTDISTKVYALQIVNAVANSQADSLLKDCTSLEKQIKIYFDDSKKTAHELHKKIVDMEKTQLDPIALMKKHLKHEMSNYIANEELYNDALYFYNIVVTSSKNLLSMENIVDYIPIEMVEKNMEVASKAIDQDRKDLNLYEFKENAQHLAQTVDKILEQIRLAQQKVIDDAIKEREALELKAKEDAEKAGEEYIEVIPEPIEEPVVIEKIEIKKPKTNLRKLSLTHSISVLSIKKLAQAVVDGNVPASWIMANESAIKQDVKGIEDTEQFYEKYKKSGVMLKINRSVR